MQAIQRWSRVVLVGAVAAALTACAAYPQGGYNPTSYPANNYPSNTYPQGSYPSTSYPVNNSGYSHGNPVSHAQQGRVLRVETVRVQDPSGVGAGGAIAGGVVGGVLGNQVGKGSGRTLATIAGVVGGALAGNAVQNSVGGGSVRDIYRVTVQMQDGSVRAFDYEYAPEFQPGEYVRVNGNQLYR